MRSFHTQVAPGVATLRGVTLMFLVATSAGLAQAQTQNWLAGTIPAEARSYDFGTVARAANTEHRFTLTNVLGQEMHVRSVRTSCGCTTPSVERDTIPPGQSGTILARFNTGSFTGQKAATITVTIDRPFFAELQLNVKGYIRSDVVLSPGEIQFGAVPEGERAIQEILLDYAGRGDWAIERVETQSPYVKATFEEVSRQAGRIQYKIRAGLDSNAPVGFIQNQLVLHTNDRRLTTVPIRVLAKVESEFQMSPQSIALGKLKPGEPSLQRLVIKGKKPFKLLEITSDAAEVRFEPIQEAKAAHLVNLTIQPNKAAGDGEVKSELLIRTDLADEPLKLEMKFELERQAGVPPPTQVLTKQSE